MRFFFDTEFTGLHKDTTLISIGIIDNEGKKAFYAELTDYDITQVDDWIRENVINNLMLANADRLYCERIKMDRDIVNKFSLPGNLDELYLVKGNKDFVRRELINWFIDFRNNDNGMIVQMVSDVSHYDFVLFIDLFGGAMDLPEWISPTCYDINQDIAREHEVSPIAAFNMTREDLVKNAYTDPSMKHNALFDAAVIGYIYYSCNCTDRSW